MKSQDSLYDPHNAGMVPGYFWHGMVVGDWEGNLRKESDKKWGIHTRDDVDGWGYRCKVAIFGRDPASTSEGCSNTELVMAEVMGSVLGSGVGGPVATPVIGNNTFVVGYYRDGVKAREPVIIGTLPNVSQSRLKEYNYPDIQRYVGSTGYKPSDKVSTSAMLSEGPSSIFTHEAAGEAKSTVGRFIQNYDGRKTDLIPSTYRCDKKEGSSELKGIQKILKEAANAINFIKTQGRAFVSAASDLTKNISSIINSATTFITSLVKTMMKKMRGYVINKFNDAVDSALDFIFPNLRSAAANGFTKAADTLTCVFNKITGLLKKILNNILKKVLGGAINSLMCSAENVVGSVLSQVLGPITSAIDSALSSINGIIDKGVGIVNQALNALDIVFGFIKLFSCEEDLACPSVKEWSFWYGPKNLADNVSKGLSKTLENISKKADESLGTGGGSAPSCSNSPILSGPPTVKVIGGGKDDVENTDIKVNPIVGTDGTILALDVKDKGIGYTSTPAITLNDPSGSGNGAVILPRLKDIESNFNAGGCGTEDKPRNPQQVEKVKETQLGDGGQAKVAPGITINLIPTTNEVSPNRQKVELKDFVILDSGVGYLSKPDGSTGANGQKFSNPEDTIVNCGNSFNVYSPCTNILVFKGDIVYIPSGTLGQVFDQDGNLLQSFTGLGPIDGIEILFDGILGTPCVKREDVIPPIVDQPNYDVVLEIGDVYIENPGINYEEGDEIIIEPDNGAILEPVFGDNGKLVDVNIINPGLGFDRTPTIYINTITGVNASIIPVFNIITLEELENRNITYTIDSNNNIKNLENIQDIKTIQQKKVIIVDNKEVPLINVIDCIGKHNE
jgi:hypothetical protein